MITKSNRDFDRRTFLKLASGTIAFSLAGSLVHGASLPRAIVNSIAGDLASDLPKLDGVFVFDDAVCRAMATDFGHFVHRMPIGVLFPKSARDVAKIVAYARRKKLKVAMRGHACSAYGQAQVDKGIVIDSTTMNHMRWISDDVIDVQPGATWWDVNEFAKQNGKAPAVFPDTLFLTIGGTLSVGGVGETSYRLGAMVDHVLELDAVTGEGETVTCSKDINPHLFSAVLAGIGQCGLVTRARIRVVDAPKNAVIREFKYADLLRFLSDQALIARKERRGAIGCKSSKNSDGSWAHFIAVTTWLDEDSETKAPEWLKDLAGIPTSAPKVVKFDAFMNRNTKTYQDQLANGSFFVPHPYMSFFVSESVGAKILSDITSTPVANLGAAVVAVFPMLTQNFRQILQRMPEGELAFHIRIYRKAKVEGDADHLKMIKSNLEDVLPKVLNAGGTVYPPHAPILMKEQWSLHFGPRALKFLNFAKGKFDPDRVLTPGAGIFS